MNLDHSSGRGGEGRNFLMRLWGLYYLKKKQADICIENKKQKTKNKKNIHK